MLIIEGVIIVSIVSSLPRSTPENQGISSEAILGFLNEVEKRELEFHSIMILRHGHVVAEGWWNPYGAHRPHSLFSLSKSFTSTAIGFAVAEGLLSVEDKVISFFPEDVPESIGENLKNMKVKHLLSMSTGHAEDTSERTFGRVDGDWVRGFLSLEVEYEPGTHFVYNTAATYMLSAIIQKLTGDTLLKYLGPRLFQPLGIEGATWESCPRGINTGGFGLSIKTEDIAKFGQLYLQNGKWEGKQIISSLWIEEATRSHISNGDNPLSDWNQGYGYQFWRCRNNAYRADGAFGQYCVVIPEQDAVIAITSALDDMQIALDLIWDRLLPEMSASAIVNNELSHKELKDKLENLKLPCLSGGVAAAISSKVSGKSFVMEANDLNIQSVSFQFESDGCELKMGVPHGEELIKCSYEDYREGITNLMGSPTPIAVCGNWKDENTFAMLLRFIETPFCYNLNCEFRDGVVELKVAVNVNFGPKEFPAITGRME